MNASSATDLTKPKSQPRFDRIAVAGCPVDILDFETAVAELCRRIEMRIQTHVAFVNAAKVVRYGRDANLRRVMDEAGLLLADGMPIVWASKLGAKPLVERVAGIDLMERMMAVSAARGYKVYLLGATALVVRRTVEVLRERYAGLQIVGFRNGYFTSEEEPTIVAEINASGAELLLLGMGTPQKEFWADRNLSNLKVHICQGVGGSFDVVAGITQRAPAWMQQCGLEWFFRFLQEPRRMWRRYLQTNTSFLYFLVRSFFVRTPMKQSSSAVVK
ncbi:MAG: WecB/TagA/CpsF family glycosyltransferase [Terracidiphilus sp.]|jgi:N-acetylglucosaminyldiphosphoundecaprenol N-acetyl-beta-D-mannosaminyltransferase